MEKKYILPASTMLGGIAVWLILFFAINWELAVLWQELLLGILVGGLIVFSAYACRGAGGPKEGNFFRAGLLTVLAILSYFFVGIISAIILLASAIAISLIALTTKGCEVPSKSVSA